MKTKKPYMVLPSNEDMTEWSVFEVIRKPTLKLVREFDSLFNANDFALKHNNDNNYENKND